MYVQLAVAPELDVLGERRERGHRTHGSLRCPGRAEVASGNAELDVAAPPAGNGPGAPGACATAPPGRPRLRPAAPQRPAALPAPRAPGVCATAPPAAPGCEPAAPATPGCVPAPRAPGRLPPAQLQPPLTDLARPPLHLRIQLRLRRRLLRQLRLLLLNLAIDELLVLQQCAILLRQLTQLHLHFLELLLQCFYLRGVFARSRRRRGRRRWRNRVGRRGQVARAQRAPEQQRRSNLPASRHGVSIRFAIHGSVS